MKQELDLTIAQTAILDLELYAGRSACVLCGSFLMRGTQTDAAVCDTLKQMIQINDAFHIRIARSGDTWKQTFDNLAANEIVVLSFDSRDSFESFAKCYAKEPMPEEKLYEFLGVRLPGEFGFLAKLHHVISDAWSGTLLCQQFTALINGNPCQAFSYEEAVKNQLQYRSGKRYEADRQFFLNQTASHAFSSSFPKKEGAFHSERFTASVPDTLYKQIQLFAASENSSDFAFLFSALTVLFKRTTGVDESFYIGTPIINRSDYKEKNTVGLFVNTVPVLASVNQENTFSQYLAAFSDNLISTMRHQRYHYRALLNQVRTVRGETNALYDVVFSFQNAIVNEENAETTWYSNDLQVEPLQIHFDHRDQNNWFTLNYDFRTDCFCKEQISAFHHTFICLLQDALSFPNKKIYELSLMKTQEVQRILYDFNNTEVPYNKDKSVYDLFRAQAERHPDKTAVIFEDQTLSFSKLLYQVDTVADKLYGLGVQENDVVAIHLNRSSWLIVFQLAVLKIGATFLPADKRYPEARLRFLCRDCDVRLMITDADISEMDGTRVETLEQFIERKAQDVHAPARYRENSYIIYTSGSTGAPKGCILRQTGLVNFCINNNILTSLKQNCDNIFVSVNSVSFDYFIAESLLPLLNGYTTVLCDEDESQQQSLFFEVLQKHHVNVLMTTPTRLALFYDKKRDCRPLQALDCVCSSGEPLQENLLERIYEASPMANVFNPLGPSECTVWDLGGELDRTTGIDVHLGKPIANTQIYILDKYLQPVPIGVTGELCIAGDCVGAGYLNRPELTAERFIDNPFGEGKLYKTGDMAYWREDGNIMFVGRNDFQVKINGQRVELGEIEAALCTLEGIESAAVVARKDETERQLLCAFYTGRETAGAELRTRLSKTLPRFMVPQVFMHLETMPLTVSGKIDRNAFPQPDLHTAEAETAYVAPRTPEETVLCKAITSVLGLDSVSMLDNFFEIGGDSIRAIYVASDIQNRGYTLSVSEIMMHDTLEGISKQMQPTDTVLLYPQNEISGVLPLSPIQHAFLHADATNKGPFLHSCILAVDCDETAVRKALDAVVLHHDLLRAVVCDDGLHIRTTLEAKAYSFAVEPRFQEDETIHRAVHELEKSDPVFDLKNGPLVAAVFCKTKRNHLLKLSIHHFLVDLISWEILLEDMQSALSQMKAGEAIVLPPKTASFPDWLCALSEYAASHISDEDRACWVHIEQELDDIKPLLVSDTTTNETEMFAFTLEKEETTLFLHEANRAFQTHPNELLLAALALAAKQVSGNSAGIYVESHGRAELHQFLSVNRTVGWFTCCYPVIARKEDNETQTVVRIKETLRRTSKGGLDYLLLHNRLHRNADILFNYYKAENKNDAVVAFQGGKALFPGKINVSCFVENDEMQVQIGVPSCPHKKGIAKALGTAFQNQISEMTKRFAYSDSITKTRSDFSDRDLKESELDDMEALFNGMGDNE